MRAEGGAEFPELPVFPEVPDVPEVPERPSACSGGKRRDTDLRREAGAFLRSAAQERAAFRA